MVVLGAIVLAIRPKVRELKPGRVVNIPHHSFLRREAKPSDPCPRFSDMLKNTSKFERDT
jgi:hypothetical protein